MADYIQTLQPGDTLAVYVSVPLDLSAPTAPSVTGPAPEPAEPETAGEAVVEADPAPGAVG